MTTIKENSIPRLKFIFKSLKLEYAKSMLEKLRIKNLVTIESVEISFQSKLNIVSGETGAGKSMLTQAISLLLGEKSNIKLIRSGTTEAIIEGIFCIQKLPYLSTVLKENQLPHHSESLVIKRVLHHEGKHRISINGEITSLSTLQKISPRLIYLCSQHEHQTLLKPATQLAILDRYGESTALNTAVQKKYDQFQKLKKKVEQIQFQKNQRKTQMEFLKFQIQEIEQAHLIENEDQSLLKEKKLLQSTEQRGQIIQFLCEILEAANHGLMDQVKLAVQKVKLLTKLDSETQHLARAIEQIDYQLEDFFSSIKSYSFKVDFDPERLQFIQERLTFITHFKKKYGSLDHIFIHLSHLKEEYDFLNRQELELEALKETLKDTEKIFKNQVQVLFEKRKTAGLQFTQSITHILKELNIQDVVLDIQLTSPLSIEDWKFSEINSMQFLISTNPGHPPQPLHKTISGGELSRFMLALRNVIGKKEQISTDFFDEIDVGIGGQTAFQVGKKLKAVTQHHQVICITHLPQIAAFADHHLVVQKKKQNHLMTTIIQALNASQRKKEVARMLGGPMLTSKSLENASELIQMAQSATE